jgi:hypothetical protein
VIMSLSLCAMAIVFMVAATPAAVVPTVDHWSAKTSVINAHRAASNAPRPTKPTAVVADDLEASKDGGSVESDQSLNNAASSSSSSSGDLNGLNVAGLAVADHSEAAVSNSDESTDDPATKKPTGGSSRTPVGSNKTPIVRVGVDKKAVNLEKAVPVQDALSDAAAATSDEDRNVEAQFAALLASKPIFTAFLDDMAAQEAQRASYQGELVDVKCPSGGGQCDLVFQHGGSLM